LSGKGTGEKPKRMASRDALGRRGDDFTTWSEAGAGLGEDEAEQAFQERAKNLVMIISNFVL